MRTPPAARSATASRFAIGTRVLLEGRLLRQKGKVAFLEGRMVKADDGSLVAETEASFMIVA